MFTRLRVSAALRSACAAAFATLFWQATTVPAQVRINEVLADNQSAVSHEGGFPDYIELHNASNGPVNLGGWSLTDDPALPQKFVLPSGLRIPANGFLLLWADANIGSAGLHTGFGLGAKGDQIRLFDAIGTLRDEVQFGLQTADRSLGRIPDGDGAWVSNEPSAGLANTAASLGDAALLRLNEWMARPASGDDWLEVFNSGFLPVALGGLVITDQLSGTPANRAIPLHSFIGARGYIQFFASDLAEPDSDHLDFKLSSDGETLTIYAADRSTILDRVTFGSQSQSVSQGRAPDGSDQLAFFLTGSATPGAGNFRELTNVVISEVLSHSDPPFEDAIELQNLTGAPVDISNWWLSDSGTQPHKYRVPAGTRIPARGFKVIYHQQFGAGDTSFALNSAEGDEVYLSAGNAAGELVGELTFVRFGALPNAMSAGRYVLAGGVDFVPLAAPTFGVSNPETVVQFRQGLGASNSAPRVGPIVLNEIHFQPADSGEEFIELHNPTGQIARLFDPLYPTNHWRIEDGITFDFPANLTLPPGGFLLVVSFDPVASPAQLAAFRATYSVPAEVSVVGPYSGRLNDTGEAVELLEPDAPQGFDDSNPGFVPYVQAERVRYGIAAPWPSSPSGTGHSLQRRVALAYGNDPLNWATAAPTAGRANLADGDGDGMPDDWEDAHNLDRDSPEDAEEDADRDGMSNRSEFLSGTDPQDAQSVFAFTRVAMEDGAFRVHFQAVLGRAYSLQQRDAAEGSIWMNVTNLPSIQVSGDQEVAVSISSNAMLMLRLVTPSQP